MDEVVASHALPWVETPDQAVVWGYALGLHHEVEDVLERSVEARERGSAAGRRRSCRRWYVPARRVAAAAAARGGSSGGMFSSSAIPELRWP